MAHVQSGSGLFVTSDKVFHGKKKTVLLKFSGGDIAKPIDVIPLAQTPASVVEFLRIRQNESTQQLFHRI
jgi:hypothetical protein